MDGSFAKWMYPLNGGLKLKKSQFIFKYVLFIVYGRQCDTNKDCGASNMFECNTTSSVCDCGFRYVRIKNAYSSPRCTSGMWKEICVTKAIIGTSRNSPHL